MPRRNIFAGGPEPLRWQLFPSVLLLIWLASLQSIAAQKVDFATDIRPIFNKNCVACHGGVKRASNVSFIVRERALSKAKSGEVPIKPGDPNHSELIRRITTTDPDDHMPPADHGPALSDHEITLLRDWIKQGAEWKEHWAYVAPKPQSLPRVSDSKWSQQPLDRFVLAKLDAEKIKPAPPADRSQWLRRVTFDLTGLPPTPAQEQIFLTDKSTNAFEKVTDTLLASPAFGERWSAMWLDLARYADTKGYEKDTGRTVWPYRDWLIRAFNSDLPYDQFITKQIAGDLLPDPTMDDQIATVFHRNTQTNVEGGTDDEEFRILAVIDRVNTTWEAIQGVTFRCAQCHSHTYDPIENEDYYRFAAFFNTSRDWDLKDDLPLLRVPTNLADFTKARELDRKMETLRADERRQTDAIEKATAKGWQLLKPTRAVSTGQTTLELKPNGEFTDVVTSGTVSHGSRFTIAIAVPSGVKRLTALRVEGLPKNLEAALLTPELGFIISRIQAYVTPPNAALPAEAATPAADADGKETPVTIPTGGREIRFTRVLGDESAPFQDPDASLNADGAGWGALPRIDRPRHAVFIVTEPVSIPEGAGLRLVMSFSSAANDEMPLVMNRGRFSISQGDEWTRLANDETFAARRRELLSLKTERDKIPGADVPIMSEQDPALKRVTAMFTRGNWLDKGKVVTAGVPKIFPALPPGATNRLALARWLTSRENPLTARVAVNRFWEQLFGLGIVETLEDFGSSGQPPSNQALLDYLAVRFQKDLNWSVKKLLREIVLSSTYRQDSRARPELQSRDPRNRLLARGPRTRLSAEMIRDQALAVSGLLSEKMFGAPVMPAQPEGVWRSVYNNARWQTSRGEDQHRRAIYTYWKRTSGYPSFLAFDMPSRDLCTARRTPTSTPLQALVTLNDPVYIECAQALAVRMIGETPSTPAGQITRGWQLAVGQKPTPADIQTLLALYNRTLEKYKTDPAASTKLAPTPELASLTITANALLNLDAILTK